MFTGLVACIGSIDASRAAGAGARIAVRHELGGDAIVVGESIGVDGCCVTATHLEAGRFEADLSSETLRRTGGLGRWRRGRRVNLERALAAGDRLGGHIVQGHVDAVVRLVGRRREPGGAWRMTFELPRDARRYVVEKGSVALDGVSLTVARLSAATFEVAVVPETWSATTLAERRPGERLNIEYDVLARYAEATGVPPGR